MVDNGDISWGARQTNECGRQRGGGGAERGEAWVVQEAVNPAELKRIIEGLPLETSAVAAVEWRLGQLDPPQFAALLTELARDNHAFRCATSIHLFLWMSQRLVWFGGFNAIGSHDSPCSKPCPGSLAAPGASVGGPQRM